MVHDESGRQPDATADPLIGHDFFRVQNGQLIEAWVRSDFFGLFMQLGAFPQVPKP